ncbi:GGDEF domain-containing protein [Paenibacillus odorifer]|uniref:GGDEF domain-containing protein n=1 Tax=Paenibacillus odorifer TaxID=189426 RepID=UPI002DB7FD58|nr:GGDEF domain-containing protein [Paenibacillus odorifer]MEC0132096.1 GGDEF domain-containing protein [Paenibacillus odorifer]MEC0220168.1 GGDEF domain-containing protein [Paenibacillus odorifer]
MKFTNMHLDLKTLLVCLFMWQSFTVLLIVVYRLRYAQERTSTFFVTAKYLQLAALILLLLNDFTDSRLPIPISMLLALAGGTLESLALLMLLRVFGSRIERYYTILFGVSIVIIVLLHLIMPDERFVMAATCLFGIMIIALPAYILAVKIRETSLQRTIGLLYFVVILALVSKGLEPFYLMLGWNAQTSHWLQIFFYLGIYLLMFLGTAGIMLLYREDSFTELERVATYDVLTGILNRRSFVQRVRPLIAASAMKKLPYSFLLLDVDHFKRINDTYGHNTGDHVLKDLAHKIKQQLGNGDLFGRFGGEEFTVLLHRADEQNSDMIAERMRTAVTGAIIHGIPLPYTISIGVITVDSGERYSLSTLYKLSDIALYQAKKKGRNCVVRSYDN